MSSDKKGHLAIVIDILQAVLDGRIDANTGLRKWPNIDAEEDRLIAASWHDLSHYAEDEDIRLRDSEYASDQRRRLEQRISALKASARTKR